MKKLMAIVMSCAMLLAAFAGTALTASAAEATPVTFTAQSVTAKAGDTITVDISVSENHYMVNGQIWVEYDPAYLEIQEVWDDPDNPYFEEINQKIFKSSFMWAFAVPEAGTAKLAFATSSSAGSSVGGVMFTLTFKVLEDARSSKIVVSVPDNDMNSNDGTDDIDEDVDVTSVDGLVTIEGAPVDGDIVLDGVIDLQDATALFYYVNGATTLEGASLEAADVNGDGVIGLHDAVTMFYQVSGVL